MIEIVKNLDGELRLTQASTIPLSNDDAKGFTSSRTLGGRTYSYSTALGTLLQKAEDLFGDRDKNWTPLGVEIALDNDTPSVWFPGNSTFISICLSSQCQNDVHRGLFQLAHEVVHLLAPTMDTASTPVIEEGLATFFSDEMSRACGWNYQSDDHRYVSAKATVNTLLTHSHDAVRILREIEPSFCKWTADLITSQLPDLPAPIALQLCTPFRSWSPTHI